MSNNRYTALKNMAHKIVGMVPDLKNHIEKFNFIFTKYNDEN
jgi:hypothetical protein